MINRVKVKAVWQFITSPDYSRTVSILALLVVVLAIPLTVFIAQKQQEIRQRAQGEAFPCSRPNQLEIGVPVGSCEPNANGCTATKFTRYRYTTDVNGDGVADPQNPGDQPWCDYVCGEPTTCPTAPTATPPPSTIVHQEFEPCPEYGANTTCNPTFSVPNIAAPNDRNQNLSCRKIGSSTNEEFEWITKRYGDQQCSNTDQVGREAQCGRQTYYCNYVNQGRGERDWGAWTTTRPAPTSTPIPTPTPVELCGKLCSIFGPGSKKDKSECEREGYYLDPSDYDGQTKTCNFACLPIPDFGTVNKLGLGGCSYSVIRPTSPPPGGGGGDDGDGGGGGGGGGGQPTAAPTQPPGALTKLLFDLILPGGTKDKRVVAQIFTATPAAQMLEDLEGTVKRGPGGNYTGTVDAVNTRGNFDVVIGSGTWNIKIKAAQYLRKLIKDVQITQNTTNRISQITLVLGDIKGDNKLNISDYNMLIDCFGGKANSQTCGNNNKDLADLDDNGRVDGVDYNLFLINLSKGPRDGD